MVRAIAQLAQALGLQLVAEGIELDVQADGLRALGCPFGQGFYFARPLTADTMGALLAARPGPRITAGTG